MIRQVKVGEQFFGDGTFRCEIEPLAVGLSRFAVRQVFEGGESTVYVYGRSDCNHNVDGSGERCVTVETVEDANLRLAIGQQVAKQMSISPGQVIWPLHPSLRPAASRPSSAVGIGVY
ncbi:MAG: hypothetical protein ABIJ46_05045 [bacterium]